MNESKKQIFLIFSKVVGVGFLFESEWDGCLNLEKCKKIAYSSYKELYNFYTFLEELDEEAISYLPILKTERKDCVYGRIEKMTDAFCVENLINTNDFNRFLRVLCLFSVISNVILEQYEIYVKNKFLLDTFISSELRYIKKLVFLIEPSVKSYFPEYAVCEFDFLKFLKICIFIRYSFNNNKFKYNFGKRGWELEIDSNSLVIINKFKYINRDVSVDPSLISFHGNNKNIDFISNSNFNHNIWIEKFNHLDKDDIFLEKEFLEKECVGSSLIIKILNYLNSTKISINIKMLEFVIETCENIEIHKISPNYLMTWLGLKDLKFFINFKNFLFLSYILDRRTRIYCKNIPINPQLDKILRPILRPEEDKDFLKININFIKENYNYFKIEEMYVSLLYVDLIFDLWREKIEKCNLTDIRQIKLSLINIDNIEIYIEKVLFLQQLMDISIRFGDFNQMIEKTIITGQQKLFFTELIQQENNLEEYFEIKSIQKWIFNEEKWLDMCWYNDASASVMQLLVIKLLNSDIFTLKIANILNNNTNFRDIYDFIVKTLCAKENDLQKWISRSLVKRIIMPGVYGQKIPKMIDECESILKKDKNWIELDQKTRVEIILKINKNCWKILEEIGLNILKYLELSRKLAKKEKIYYWNSMIGAPILIGKSKNVDRIKLLKKLIKTKSKVSSLKIKDKLNEDEKNCCRKNIKLEKNKFNKKYIKIRLKLKSKKLDINALLNGLCPSSIHSEDASILIKIIEECSYLGIGVIPIHDSIGSKIYFSSILKCVYKKKFIEYIEYILSEKEFPINLIISNSLDEKFTEERELKKKKFEKIKKEVIQGIKESNNIFN